MKKQRGVCFAGVALALISVFFLSASVMASAGEKAVHPEISEQEMLIACSDCHRDATPEIEKEWYNSVALHLELKTHLKNTTLPETRQARMIFYK